MELKTAVERIQRWRDETHALTLKVIAKGKRRPFEDEADELAALFLDDSEWTGDAPFVDYVADFRPPKRVGNKANVKKALRLVPIYKAEVWSAPEFGGVVRVLVGGNHSSDDGHVRYAIDLAQLGDAPRAVALHAVCHVCCGLGVFQGAMCTSVDADGFACIDGLKHQGGLALDPGERAGGERFDVEAKPEWEALLTR